MHERKEELHGRHQGWAGVHLPILGFYFYFFFICLSILYQFSESLLLISTFVSIELYYSYFPNLERNTDLLFIRAASSHGGEERGGGRADVRAQGHGVGPLCNHLYSS